MSKRASIGLAKPDLQFTNCGSFATCVPETDAGREWLNDNVPDWDSGEGVAVIEFRYLEGHCHRRPCGRADLRGLR